VKLISIYLYIKWHWLRTDWLEAVFFAPEISLLDHILSLPLMVAPSNSMLIAIRDHLDLLLPPELQQLALRHNVENFALAPLSLAEGL
jgi:hypothetical protein